MENVSEGLIGEYCYGVSLEIGTQFLIWATKRRPFLQHLGVAPICIGAKATRFLALVPK